MRLTPYRTSENTVAGVVVSFVNISKLKALNLLNTELRDRRDYAFSIIEAIGFPLLVLDGDFKVLTANLDFYRVFQVTPLETEGMLLSQLSEGRWNIRELEEKLTTIIAEGISFRSFLLDYEFPGVGYKKIYLDAHRINSKKPSADLILVIFKTEN